MKLEWKTCFRAGVSIFLLYLCITCWQNISGFMSALFGAAVPLIIGAALAYLINILMSLFERFYFPNTAKPLLIKSRRPVCMAGAILSLLALITLIVSLVAPQLVSCVQLIFAQLPGAIDRVIDMLARLDILPEDIIDFLNSIDWRSRIGQIANVLTSGIGNVLGVVISTVSSLFSGIVTAFLALIFAIYLLISKEKLGSQFGRLMRRYLSARWQERLAYILTVLNDCFRGYIVGQCTEAVILGLLCTAGMLVFSMPYATMIGALVAFTALIPVAGAYIGAGVGAFMILTVSPVKALFFLLFILILQQFEGNIIYPRVVGSSLGLPGIWVLAAVTVGGGIMGIPGMLLGVPLADAAYRFLRDDVNRTPGRRK